MALQMKKKGKTLPEIQKVIDQAYKHEYPFDEMSPAYKKYHAAKLWKDTSNPLDKGGSQGSASSTKDNNASTTGDAKGIKSASGAVNAKSSTKGSCCGGKTKAK